mgnify:FL=1|tara:strand:+ start:492 stop:764 length:273 start_codon:yes stop_codon:yes gene_type:complete
MDSYFSLAIFVFFCILSVYKYTDKEKLRETIQEYLAEISPLEVIEEPDDIVELEDISELVYDFVIRNREIFSKIKVKDELSGTEGDKKLS